MPLTLFVRKAIRPKTTSLSVNSGSLSHYASTEISFDTKTETIESISTPSFSVTGFLARDSKRTIEGLSGEKKVKLAEKNWKRNVGFEFWKYTNGVNWMWRSVCAGREWRSAGCTRRARPACRHRRRRCKLCTRWIGSSRKREYICLHSSGNR